MASSTALAIADLANGTPIASFNWADRGVAPPAYVRGMAVGFARTYCKLNANRDAASETAVAVDPNDTATDALAFLATDFANASMDNSNSGVDVLRHVFVLLMGLGMRESSGQFCTGMFQPDNNTDAATAEAGLFQVSFNSASAHFLLPAMFQQYKGSTDFQDIFSVGVTCDADNWKNWGTGDGQDFQALTKNCPAFAVEYAALAVRKVRQLWAPINKSKVELKSEADDLFKTVCTYVDTNGITEV